MTFRIIRLMALIFAVSLGGSANAQIWDPYVEIGGRTGSSRDLGQGNLFLPIWQDGESLLFADLRGQYTDTQAAEGNWGLAYRRKISEEWVAGAYGFFDLRHSRFGNNFQQGTAGAELLSVNWGFRANAYIPDRDADFVTGAPGRAILRNGSFVLQRSQERAYFGGDLEVERLVWFQETCNRDRRKFSAREWLRSLDAELWASAGLYHFDNQTSGFENITGPRLRSELRLYDLPFVGNDSRLVLAGEYEYDEVRGSVGSGMLTMRIPLGPGGKRSRLTGLNRRMVAPIVRDIDIITNTGIAEEPGRIAATGQDPANIIFVDGNTANPERVIEAAGVNSLVIVDGSAGTIFPASTIDMPTGQVIMGGGSGLQVVGCNTGGLGTFIAPGIRGVFNDSSLGPVVRAGNNSSILGVDLIADFSVVSGGSVFFPFPTSQTSRGIEIDGVSNVLIDNVNIQTALVSNVMPVSSTGGIGISASSSQFAVRNSTITSDGPGDSFAGINADFSRFSVDNTTIRTTNGRGIGTFNGQLEVRDSTILAGGGFEGILSGFTSSSLLVDNSTIQSGGDGIVIFENFTTSGVVNATITNNVITSGTSQDEVRAITRVPLNLNITGNTLDGGNGTIRLSDIGGDINVRQGPPGSGAGGIDVLNGIPAGNVLITDDPVDFDQPVP